MRAETVAGIRTLAPMEAGAFGLAENCVAAFSTRKAPKIKAGRLEHRDRAVARRAGGRNVVTNRALAERCGIERKSAWAEKNLISDLFEDVGFTERRRGAERS